MIITNAFVWQHFPKCGGHAVEHALRAMVASQSDAHSDAPDIPAWHDSVSDRIARQPGFELGSRVVVSGFRRLPYWLLSRVHYEASRPPYLCATREMLCRGEFFHQNGDLGHADVYAKMFGALPVDRWIRTEHLAEDFERAFIDLIPLHLYRAAVRKVRRVVNGAQLNYVRDLGFYFTPEELEGLYAANPTWAALEREVYGDLLTLADTRRPCWYVIDHRMIFVAASPAAVAFWDRPRAAVIGRRLVDVFPKAKGSEAVLAIEESLRTRRPRRLATVSPTYGSGVEIDIIPQPRGLQVQFQFAG